MEPPVPPLLFAVVLFLGMLILLEVGRQFGIKSRAREPERDRVGLGTIENAVFALFGLLMAFTFSGADSRFSEKQMLIAEEANAIETAYLRLQLLSPESRSELQELVRRYVDSRLETYRKLPDMPAAAAVMNESKKLREQIWVLALAAARQPGSDPAAGWLVTASLNNMINIAATRTMALQIHPPSIIYALLFGLGLLCSLLAGYRLANAQRRNWLHILSFSLITVIVAYVVLDIEYPRAGLIRLETADRLLLETREGMH